MIGIASASSTRRPTVVALRILALQVLSTGFANTNSSINRIDRAGSISDIGTTSTISTSNTLRSINITSLLQALVIGIPEWTLAASLCEEIWHKYTGAQRYQYTGCVVVLARGLRGVGGVRWLHMVVGKLFPAPSQSIRVLNRSNIDQTFRNVATKVINLFDKECSKRNDFLWAGHREGRHAANSGFHFIKALKDERAMKVGVDIAERAAAFFEKVDSADDRVLPDSVLIEVLGLWKGAVLAVRKGVPIKAQKYSSMDFGRFLIAWAIHTGPDIAIFWFRILCTLEESFEDSKFPSVLLLMCRSALCCCGCIIVPQRRLARPHGLQH